MVYSFIEQWGEGKLKRLLDVIKKLFEKNGSMASYVKQRVHDRIKTYQVTGEEKYIFLLLFRYKRLCIEIHVTRYCNA